MKTQLQIYWQEHNNIARGNELFMNMVRDGLTKKELATNIARRPELWGRFESWLDKLPAANIDDTKI